MRVLHCPSSGQRLYDQRLVKRTHHAVPTRCSTTTTTNNQVFTAPPVSTNLQYNANTNTLTTTAPVKPRATVFEVPASEWLTTATVASSPIGSAVQGLEPWLQLALYLIYNDMLQDTAFPNVPLLWDDADKGLLRGSQLEASMQGYAAFFTSKHKELMATLYAQNPNLFPTATFTAPALTRAACAVRAATFSPLEGERIALVPGLGCLAHRRRDAGQLATKAGGLFGSGGDKLVFEAGEGGLEQGAVVAVDLSKGGVRVDSQMVLDYGTRVFGAVDDFKDAARHANPGYILSVTIPESDPFVDDKVDILSVNRLDQTESFTLTPSDPPPGDLLAFLRLLNLNGADAFLLEALFRNEVWDHVQDPISEENERAVCLGIIEGCREALVGYGSSIDEDLALLRGGELSPEALAAVLVRLGEKEAIDATLQWFEERLQQLGRLEYYAERRLKRLGLLDDSGRTTYDSFFEDGIA